MRGGLVTARFADAVKLKRVLPDFCEMLRVLEDCSLHLAQAACMYILDFAAAGAEYMVMLVNIHQFVDGLRLFRPLA